MKPSMTEIAFGIATIAMAGTLAGCGGTRPRSAVNGGQTYVATTMPLAAADRIASEAIPAKDVTLVVKSDEEHARKGPEGEWHDAFLPARVAARPGQRVNVTVYNYDEGEHSFTAPTIGLNVTLAGGSAKAPRRTTFSFVAPKRSGSYEWFCIFPCDPWAMGRADYMHGYVVVT